MILILDNYDSFTYNLAQRLGESDPSRDIRIYRNDEITVEEIQRQSPRQLIISPGPCTPTDAGISVHCVRQLAGRIPILGVCLGHQSIGQAFGATIVRARRLMHGKTDRIHHRGDGLFSDLPNPLVATRYHSLLIDPATLDDHLFEVTAWSDGPDNEREIMGIRHKDEPIYGVQFHPESFLTEQGPQILENFIHLTS